MRDRDAAISPADVAIPIGSVTASLTKSVPWPSALFMSPTVVRASNVTP